MHPDDKDKLRARLLRAGNKEPSYEQKKQAKQRARERGDARGRERPRARRFDEDGEGELAVPPRAGSRRSAAPPGREGRAAAPAAPAGPAEPERGAPASGELARVIGIERDRLLLSSASGACFLPASPRTAELAIGDWLRIERLASSAPRHAGDGPPSSARERCAARLIALQPRRSKLARPDPAGDGRELVLAANVDLALIVASAASPALKPGLIDRLLVAVQAGGLRALVVLNKLDLVRDDAERARLAAALAPYPALGCRVLQCSTASGAGLAELRSAIAGQCCVLVGHSGVGKSSLLNALEPAAARATGPVRADDGRGRHTTSSSVLRALGAGTELIDTPGVRAFGLAGIAAHELRHYFPDFAQPARACRFRDCSHAREPECGVRAAAERGELSSARLAVYARLLQQLQQAP